MFYSDLIQPICLPIESNLRDTVLTGQSVYVAGWGNTQATSSYRKYTPYWFEEIYFVHIF